MHMHHCTRLSAQVPLKPTTAFQFSDFNEIFIKFCVKHITDSVPSREFFFENFSRNFIISYFSFLEKLQCFSRIFSVGKLL